MDEKVNKIGRARSTSGSTTSGPEDWRKGVIREAVRHADAKIREAETRPCVSCGNGRVLEPPCPEPLCKDGRVPRDYATLAKLVPELTQMMRHADAEFEETGGSTRHYVRDCLGPRILAHARAKYGAAGEEATDDRG